MKENKVNPKDVNFKFNCPKCGEPIRCACGAKVKDLETAEIIMGQRNINYCTNCGEKIASSITKALATSQEEFFRLSNARL